MADQIIGSLIQELKLSADSFNNGLKDAAKQAGIFEKNIKPTLQAAKDLGIGMAAAGGAIVGGMLAAAKSAVDYADKLNDLRQKSGASVETLAKLGFAAEQSGSSMDGLATGLKFLAKNMEAAGDGSKKQLKAFADLGVSSKDLAAANGDVNAVMLLVADTFAGMEDGAEKTALAMNIFGKSGADLIPMLNEGSAGIKALGDEAERAGLVISQDFATASDKLNDTLNTVTASMMGLAVSVATALLPALQFVAEAVVSVVQWFKDFAAENQTLTTAVFAVGAVLLTVGTTMAGVAVVLPTLVSGFGMLSTAVTFLGGAMAVLSGAAIVGLIIALGALAKAAYDAGAAHANLQKSIDGMKTSQDRAIESLRAHGIAIDVTGMSAKDATIAIANASKSLVTHKKANNDAAEAATWFKTRTEQVTSTVTKGNAAIEAFKLRIEAQKVAAEKAAEATKAWWQSLHDSLTTIPLVRDSLDTITAKINDFWNGTQTAYDKWAAFKDLLGSSAPEITGTAGLFENVDFAAANAAGSIAGLSINIESLRVKATASMGDVAMSTKEVSAAAAEMSRAWETAIGNVTSGIAKGLSDAILKAKSFKDSMIAVFKEAASGMLQAFIAGLINPLMTELGKLGASLGSKLSGIFGGGAGIAGIFGGGGAATAGVGFGIGGTGGVATAGTAGAAGVSAATIAATAGIGAAVVAAFAIMKSQAHHEANTFVQKFQNPFGRAIADISTAFASAEASGNLTVEAAESAEKAIRELWEGFTESANEFATHGTDEARVVNQAFAQLTPLMTQIFADMQKSIAKLKDSGDAAGSATKKALTSQDDLTDSIDGLKNSANTAVDAIKDLANAIDGLAGAASTGGTRPSSTTTTAPTPAGSPSGTELDELERQRRAFFGSSAPPVVDPLDELERQRRAFFSSLPQLDLGTDYVPRTAPYMLHQGEAVISPADNADIKNLLTQILSAIRRGSTLVLDGQQIGKTVGSAINRLTEHGGNRLVATELRR